MEVGSFGVLDMSRVYTKTLLRTMFYSWWNCPLKLRYEEEKVSLAAIKRENMAPVTMVT